jgi:hypothetical protein
MIFRLRIAMESQDIDPVAKIGVLEYAFRSFDEGYLLEGDNNNILFSCKMLPIVIANLSTPSGVTAPIYIDHHSFVGFPTSRNPDIQS